MLGAESVLAGVAERRRGIPEECPENNGALGAQHIAVPRNRARAGVAVGTVEEGRGVLGNKGRGIALECRGAGGTAGGIGAEALKGRDDGVAQGSAEAGGVGVGGILAPGPAGGRAEALEIIAARVKAWADDEVASPGQAAAGGHTGEAAGASAAEERHQDGLELV